MTEKAGHEGMVREAVDWEHAQLIVDFEPPNPQLTVSGTTPVPMTVVIEPNPDGGVLEPEYWPTFVAGYHGAMVPDVVTPYSASLPLDRLSRGIKGIELIGKTLTKKIDIPG